MTEDRLPNIHPGEVLLEEFMRPLGLSQNRVARDIGVPVHRVHQLVHRKRSFTANTALRLGKYLGTGPEFWLNLQATFDLEEARSTVSLDGIRQVAA